MNGVDIINKISDCVKELNIEQNINDEGELILFSDYFSGIRLCISCSDNDLIEFYFFQRTESFMYDGDRTDLNDIISVVFAVFLRFNKTRLSCELIDVPHPVCASCNDNEIYARYIIPLQTKNAFTGNSEDTILFFESLILYMRFCISILFNSVGCPCKNCREEKTPPYNYLPKIDKILKSKIINIVKEKQNWNASSRCLPNWQYYKNFDEGVSVIKSHELASLLNDLVKLNIDDDIFVNGIEGELVFNDELSNIIKYDVKRRANSILKSLCDSNSEAPKCYPLENLIVISGKEHVLFLESISDKYEFRKDKERLKKRQEKENRLLFPIYNFEWSDKIDPELFESLIKDILERESNVIRVRKVAPLNQPDGGRDIIIEKRQAVDFDSKGNNPFVVKKIIVQCKAYKKNVGKGSVNDILDTIDYYDYDGYLLVVSSQLTTPLTDRLDKLRTRRGLDIDWWNRNEIEDRLNVHRDLLKKYSDIVQASVCEL